MNKQKVFAALIMPLLALAPLFAAEEDLRAVDYVKAFLSNQFLQENIRLTQLAEESYAAGEYDQAVQYAEEAIKYAQMSDDYITGQMRMKEAEAAIAEAQARIDWAMERDAPNRYAEIWTNAETAFSAAQEAMAGENWNTAVESAALVVTILQDIPDEPVLPAQYIVKSWYTTKDCLWNIAAKAEIYGDPFKWRILYNANRNKLPIPENPDLIHPDFVLDIPSINGEFRSGVFEEGQP